MICLLLGRLIFSKSGNDPLLKNSFVKNRPESVRIVYCLLYSELFFLNCGRADEMKRSRESNVFATVFIIFGVQLKIWKCIFYCYLEMTIIIVCCCEKNLTYIRFARHWNKYPIWCQTRPLFWSRKIDNEMNFYITWSPIAFSTLTLFNFAFYFTCPEHGPKSVFYFNNFLFKVCFRMIFLAWFTLKK